MICAVGSIMLAGSALLGNGLATVAPFTTRRVVGLKISFGHTAWPAGSGPLQGLIKPGTRSGAKFPARSAAVGTIVCVLVVKLFCRNCSKLKKKKVLSWPL